MVISIVSLVILGDKEKGRRKEREEGQEEEFKVNEKLQTCLRRTVSRWFGYREGEPSRLR